MLRSRNTRWLVLLGILLLAALGRIYHINLQSLWIDEGFTWNLTQYHDPLLILRRDVHPPLYFLLVDAWVQISGTSVLALRFFSVLPGMISIAVVYQLAREIERQRGTNSGYVIPVLAALLLAVADPEINLAQETRSYTWHVLFASGSMWGFLRWNRSGGRFWLGLWLLNTIALVYTFYLGAFVGVAQGIYALLFLRGGKRLRALVVLLVSALALIPWLALTAGEQAQNISRGEVILPDAYLFWLNDFRQGYFSGQWALLIGLLLLGLVLVRDREGVRLRLTPMAVLLLLWFGVPLLLTLIGNQFTPLYQPRRVTQIVPAIVLLTACGLDAFPRPSRHFLALVIVVYSVSSVDFWKVKPLWKELAAETAPLIVPDTPLLLEIGGDDYAPRYHYGQALPGSQDLLLDKTSPPENSHPIIGLTTWRHLEPESYTGGLPAFIDSQRHLWLLYWSSDQGALYWLEQFNYQRTATIQADFNPDVYLYRYDRLPDEPVARFGNGMILHEALLHPSGHLEMLWSAEQRLPVDYTVSVFLLDESGTLAAQADSQPFMNQRPTSGWQTDEIIYDFKQPVTASGEPLAAGAYRAGISVYTVVEGVIQQVPVQGEMQLIVGEIRIEDQRSR